MGEDFIRYIEKMFVHIKERSRKFISITLPLPCSYLPNIFLLARERFIPRCEIISTNEFRKSAWNSHFSFSLSFLKWNFFSPKSSLPKDSCSYSLIFYHYSIEEFIRSIYKLIHDENNEREMSSANSYVIYLHYYRGILQYNMCGRSDGRMWTIYEYRRRDSYFNTAFYNARCKYL